MPDVRRGHCDVFSEASVAIDADDLRVWADVRVSSSAKQTTAVDDVALGGDAISLAHVGDETADLRHFARELVSDDDWWFHAALRPRIPVVDVHVSAAHAGASYANQNFIVPDGRHGNVFENETRGRGCFHQRFHARVAPC